MEGKIVYKGASKKGHSFVIRYPALRDVEALRTFVNTLSQEKTFFRYQGEKIDLSFEQEYITKQLEKMKDNRAVLLYAFIDDKPIGTANIEMKEQIEKYIGNFGIAILKEFRGEGIGKTLLQVLLEESDKHLPDLRMITLNVWGNNHIAYEWYKKLGFTEFGRLPKSIIHRGEFVDYIYMYKQIDSTKK